MRRSDLGNLVASNMAAILDSDEHRSLFSKVASGCKCDCKKCEDCKCEGDCPDSCDCSMTKDAGLELEKDCTCKCDKCKKLGSGHGDSKCNCSGEFGKSASDIVPCTCGCAKCKEAKPQHTPGESGCCKKEAAEKCKCDCKKCEDCKGECPCAKKEAALRTLFNDCLKLSEDCDNLGLEKTAAKVLSLTNLLVAEAAGEEELEQLISENPDANVTEVTFSEEGLQPEAPEALQGLEMGGFEDEEDIEGLAEELEGLEAGSLGDLGEAGSDELTEEDKAKLRELGLDAEGLGLGGEPGIEEELGLGGDLGEIAAATAEVDRWLQKHSADDSNDLQLDADLRQLLSS